MQYEEDDTCISYARVSRIRISGSGVRSTASMDTHTPHTDSRPPPHTVSTLAQVTHHCSFTIFFH